VTTPGRATCRVGALVAVLVIVLVSCASRPSSSSGPSAPPGMLDGWKLTLPVAGTKGDAQTVDPAAVTPPWLTTDAAGHLVFWAPVDGVTTKDSEHARTELDRLENFTAGSGPQTLTASVAVGQVPAAVPAVIVGQIHGAGDISAVPFVMLFYEGGTVRAVVKQERSGEAHTDLPLLTAVPLGASFDYSITDDGGGGVTVTATYAGRTASASATVPAAFAGRTVRFQAGAYQQAPSAGGNAAADDGARVTFSAITVGTTPAPSATPAP
jgi:Alginate lyase